MTWTILRSANRSATFVIAIIEILIETIIMIIKMIRMIRRYKIRKKGKI